LDAQIKDGMNKAHSEQGQGTQIGLEENLNEGHRLYELGVDGRIILKICLKAGCTNPERQVAMSTKFCTVAPKTLDLQYGTCVTSPLRCLQFLRVSYIFGKYLHSCIGG
jgi:hypothetical protein